ncbi:MAG: ABC transporter substrate-binding protein [Clostridium sp.]|jgi:NitT/TauT family transport system substrate-binding protein|uniref:ABC transporter substrate-binding protein n=1 Tax=Clostridium sp. TaxID=1506 RepID=UPI0025BB3FDE|nr:ABC transporter substrate-binding protein [Clostridium sp.]MCH3964855.1 ABC transporter substrate-binding protein [Clostridium sp.]MCI1716650.1 ABC transporter substrate-binding protein [Clostridium sp.]MCI1800868.1 ABC transporter substrate-binding protein [Clostridium sp.]MCI1814827.1 ABC transporter substrate-binding protein [Clostridium sp.]MCI1871615.1 ABC transporter substrate-binding protein [Clostridium sp.]
MKKLNKRVISISIMLMVFIMAFTGCQSKTGGSNDKSSSEKVYKLGISAYPAFYTWYITQAEGFFKARGINVKLVYFPVYSDSVQAFNTGKIDMLSAAVPDIIAPYVNDIGFETVLLLDNSNGADGLVAGKGINSIKDLKGKSVATEYGTIEHFFLLNALKTAGMTEKDVKFVNLSIADAAPAFLSGKVDAACLWEPSLSKALSKDGSKLLVSSKDTPGLIPDVLVANKDMVQNGKSDIEKVVNAYYDSMEFYAKNKDKAIQDMAKGAGISADEMKVAMSGSKLFTIKDSIDAMDKQQDNYSYLPYTTEKIAEFLKKVKMIDEMPDNTKKMYNSTYLKDVLKTRESKPVPDTTK